MHRPPEQPGVIEINGIRLQAPSSPAPPSSPSHLPMVPVGAPPGGLPVLGSGADAAVLRSLAAYRRPLGAAMMSVAVVLGVAVGLGVGMWLALGALWGVLAGLGVSIVPWAGGLFLWSRGPKHAALLPGNRQLEHGILAFARSRGGVVTAAEAALELRVGVQDVQDELRRLAQRGTCEHDFDIEQGREIYVFPDFRGQLPPAER